MIQRNVEALSETHILHHISSKITAWEASDALRKQLEHFVPYQAQQ